MKNIHLKSTFIVVIILFVFCNNHFGQHNKKQIKKMTESSELIIIGKVANLKSSWNEKKTRISTQVTISAEEFVKGNNNTETLIVTIPGGEVGNVGELYTHMPKFNNDEEVLLFVRKNKKDNNYRVIDGENGKISLHRDKFKDERVTSSNKTIKHLKEEIKLHLRK